MTAIGEQVAHEQDGKEIAGIRSAGATRMSECIWTHGRYRAGGTLECRCEAGECIGCQLIVGVEEQDPAPSVPLLQAEGGLPANFFNPAVPCGRDARV